MSSTVDASVAAKKLSHKPKSHKPKRANHGRSKHATTHAAVPPKTRASTSTPHASHASVVAPRRVVGSTPTTTSTSQRIGPKPVPDVLQQVATAVQDAFSLFGWNLLALIPIAGIAIAISRQMKSPRGPGSNRSGSRVSASR
ncbi:hypothetical protein Back2_27660 [Nocardioides baekrokdamisoli]|uniref:Uncharacterized protein n=2 Tax=Nocardioides baekrokdamisoli TaxID=1804624 RepID=A0A3G9J639_9ACTN|nr:hypothetical protein Back2_27660 [Nocardioides baekrokdamisoli]